MLREAAVAAARAVEAVRVAKVTACSIAAAGVAQEHGRGGLCAWCRRWRGCGCWLGVDLDACGCISAGGVALCAVAAAVDAATGVDEALAVQGGRTLRDADAEDHFGGVHVNLQLALGVALHRQVLGVAGACAGRAMTGGHRGAALRSVCARVADAHALTLSLSYRLVPCHACADVR